MAKNRIKRNNYKKGDELNVFEVNHNGNQGKRNNVDLRLDKDEEFDNKGEDDDSDDERLRKIKIDHLRDGEVDDEDDEDIDSDDAFEGDSDEDRFADWAFAGSKNPNKVQKSKGKGKNVSEDDDEVEEEEEEEEGMVDLSTMLDDDNQFDEDVTREDVEDSDIEIENENDEDDDNEEEDDNEGDSNKLNDIVNSLDPSSKSQPQSRSKTTNDATVFGQNSEFRVPTEGQVSLDSLLAPLPTGIASTLDNNVKPLKPSKAANAKRGPLSAPLATFYKERADREAGQKVIKEDVKQWGPTMKTIEEANHLSFPLQPGQDGEDGNQAGGDLVGRFQPANDLEKSVDHLLKSNNLSTKPVTSKDNDLPEQSNSKLNKDQLKAKYAALRHQRQLMYETEKKAARLNKIKSKTFRRLKRKEKEANKQKAQEAGLLDSDEERMDAERERALERATLRHKGGNSKWAKEMKDRSDGDRDVLNELNSMEELGKRIRGQKPDNDDSDEDEHNNDIEDSDDEAVRSTAINQIEKLKSNNIDQTLNENFKGIAGMKFMRDAAARERKEFEDDAEAFANEIDNEDDGDNRLKVGGNPGRFVIAPGKKPVPQVNQTQDDIPIPPITSSHTHKSDTVDNDQNESNFNTFRERFEAENDLGDEDNNPWLNAGNGQIKKSKKKNVATLSKDSSKVDKSTDAFKKRKRNIDGLNDDDAVDVDMNATLVQSNNSKKKQKKQKNKAQNDSNNDENYEFDSDTSDEDAEMAGGGVQAFKQRDLVAEAFAADDVVQEFEEEKRKEMEEEAPHEVDTSLPGWGSWGGKGVKVNKNKEEEKRKKFIKKTQGVETKDRKDANKSNVIISEKTEKRPLSKYSLKDIPYPYTSRAQYEKALQNPVGQEWNSKQSSMRMSAPKIQLKPGQVIQPMKRKF